MDDQRDLMKSFVKRQKDGSWYLSGLVLRDAMDDVELARIIATELLGVILSGTVLPGMVAIQFAPTPYDWNCSPDNCTHPIESLEPTGDGKGEWEDWGSIRCTICKSHLGWWCPKSPDHHCHYFTSGMVNGEKFFVFLSNGFTYTFPQHPNVGESESEDQCLFCGHPEERK